MVFVDIRPDTLNIDEAKIEEAVTEHTKVIIPVHYAGVACEMDDIYAQLENMEAINKRRSRLFGYYYKALILLVNDGKLRLPYVSSECESNSHLFYIILKDEKARNALMNHLKSRGILVVFHYLPLHLSQVGRSMGYTDGQLPVTQSMSGRLLRLPFYYELKQTEQDEIVDAIKDFFK